MSTLLTSQTALVGTAAIVLLPLCLVLSRSYVFNKRKDSPPAPPGHWFFGHGLEISTNPSVEPVEVQMYKYSLKHGLVFSIYNPLLGSGIVIQDPALIKQVYVKRVYAKSPMYWMVKPIFGKKSMLLADDDTWKRKRKAFNPGFVPQFLRTCVDVMAEKLDRFVANIEDDIDNDEDSTNMLIGAQRFTSDVIVSIAFGENWGADDGHPSLEREIDVEMKNVVERRLAEGVSSSSRDICSLAINDLMQEDGTLSDGDKEDVAHQLRTFYFAGHDTTAATISWAIWSLSQHPDILARVRREAAEIGMWSSGADSPSYEQLQKCSYTEAVVNETLRLYPPSTSTNRFTPDMKETYNGYSIGGQTLIFNTYGLHRHPDLWNDPLVFRPERFLDGSEKNIKDKFFPFSLGPRDCIGKYFAMMEAKLCVSALCALFDFSCVDKQETLVTQITSRPKNGAKVKFQRRGDVK